MGTKTASLIFGIAFLAVGILGFFSNPIIGESENVIFHSDTTHNIVHLASGILFLLFGLAIPAAARAFFIIFGLVYLGLGVMGFMNFGTEGMGTLLGFLHVNGADNYLHAILGVAILLTGIFLPGYNP